MSAAAARDHRMPPINCHPPTSFPANRFPMDEARTDFSMAAVQHSDALRAACQNQIINNPFSNAFSNQNQLYLNALQRGYYGLPLGLPNGHSSPLPHEQKYFCLPYDRPMDFLKGQPPKPGMFFVGPNPGVAPFDVRNIAFAQTFPSFIPPQLASRPFMPSWPKEISDSFKRPKEKNEKNSNSMEGIETICRSKEGIEKLDKYQEGMETVYRLKQDIESAHNLSLHNFSKFPNLTENKDYVCRPGKSSSSDADRVVSMMHETEPISDDESPHVVSSTNPDEEECVMCSRLQDDSIESKQTLYYR